MENSLVSVVITAYNAEEFIVECLSAVKNQTYTNLQVIMVDDGSTDETLQICRSYCRDDLRFSVVHINHGGVSRARNTGIEFCEGEFVVFFDSDDYPDVNLIQNYMDLYNKWNISFAMCGISNENIVNKNVSTTKMLLEESKGYVEGSKYLIPQDELPSLCWLRLFNFVTNKCYRLSFIIDNNIRFYDQMQIAEDLQFNIDYLSCCKSKIGMINAPLYHYIKREELGLSVKPYKDCLRHTKLVYNNLISYARANDYDDESMLVFESLYIMDWIYRLSAIYNDDRGILSKRERKLLVHREINCSEFKELLDKSFKGKKISKIRYLALRTRLFWVFNFLRNIYQWMKG